MLAERRRPARVDRAAGIPDRLVPRLRARRAVHPGGALLDDERRHRPRARHPDRVLQPALADARARVRRSSPASSRGSSCSGVLQAVFYIAVGLTARRPLRRRARPGSRVAARLRARSSRSAFGALGSWLALPHRLGRVDPGALPAPLRLPVHLVDEHAAQPDRASTGSAFLASINPVSYLIECVRSLIITGWDARGARARVRHRDRARDRRCHRSRAARWDRRLERDRERLARRIRASPGAR